MKRWHNAVRVLVIVLAAGWFWHEFFGWKGTVVLAPIVAAGDARPGIDAAGILAEVEATYHDCVTYNDRGSVVAIFDGEDRRPSETRFETAFRRPDKLRFEFWKTMGNHGEFVIKNGDKIKSYIRPARELGPESSVDDELMGFRGVSCESSTNVPSLLLGGALARLTPLRLADPVYARDVLVGADACEEITGTIGDRSVSLYISKASPHLRRITSHFKLNELVVDETTDFDFVDFTDHSGAPFEFPNGE